MYLRLLLPDLDSMNSDKIAIISEGIEALEGVAIIEPFAVLDGLIQGTISISLESKILSFGVTILPHYPFQFHEMETIRFMNPELLDYPHVNRDGSICVHTPHNADLRSKIFYDVSSLKQWMLKYYVSKEIDNHYEHILISESTVNKRKQCYLFTDTDYAFKKGDFGLARYALMAEGVHNKMVIDTYIIQQFKIQNKHFANCKWSTPYQQLPYQEGVYIFVGEAPVHHRRFIVENWIDLERSVTQDFLKFLDSIKKNNSYKKKGITSVPFFVGYNIPSGEVHWQCAVVEVNNFPNYAEKGENGSFIGRLCDKPVSWVQTKNCSYHHFFGRGALHPDITEKKILIIGIGAIGSIISETFVRGGCKDISLIDYDIKEPENVCRSQYQFISGLNSKVSDLKKKLIEISPFVKVSIMPEFMDAVKAFIGHMPEQIKLALEEYDFILDCSADSDVIYILDSLQLAPQVLSFSITNHAKDLVCAANPDLYNWTQQTFEKLREENDHLYHPIGCWHPTFRASYNDINTLVQYAIKHINHTVTLEKSLRSFHLSTDYTGGFTIKLDQY